MKDGNRIGAGRKGVPDIHGRDEIVYGVIFDQPKTDNSDCERENENEVLK